MCNKIFNEKNNIFPFLSLSLPLSSSYSCSLTIGYKPSYKNRESQGDAQESTCGRKLNGRQGETVMMEVKVLAETSYHESKWPEHSPRHRVTLKKFHGRYSDDDSSDGDDYGSRKTGHKWKSKGGTDSEVHELVDDEKDRRNHMSSRKYNMEVSSADQEESHEHDRVHTGRDKSRY
ncbi:unnamed protein product [Arabis nemorensis]|uniref:Uncharacterized protein n=1 Tax=Arabis nemorensis TaxID=586526 RepID=A0A565BC85_9BRAS|nr:unnamed protein product [Arabis nemorensis]